VGKGGIIRVPSVHARVVDEITAAADALGLTRAGMTESPIAGMEGNREFLLHLRRRA
jgi:23S rRNA (cytidine1920-2'-O)/16S rRNA (cytidine1409-2'-O)-methyltransferase